ncbi:MAG: response regulator [Ardenticatenaceae bacterium]
MNHDYITVLLIEDNFDDANLLREILTEIIMPRFEFRHVERLSDALQFLDSENFDVILLDLSLPDTQGLKTLVRLRESAVGLPIIVLTGTDDESVAIQAVQLGAQDYLVKGRVSSDLLVRAIRYAIERQLLLAQLEQTRQREQQESEFRSLVKLSTPAKTSVTAQLFGLVPLRQGEPHLFKELIERYAELLERSLEQQAFKVDYNISHEIRAISQELGFLKAGPRDLIEIHTLALQKKTSRATPAKGQAYLQEGRMMLLELMGYLLAFYRNISLGI